MIPIEPNPAAPDEIDAQTPPGVLADEGLADNDPEAQAQAGAEKTLRPPIPDEGSPAANLDGEDEPADWVEEFTDARAVPIPKDSTLVEVTARVCTVDGSIYDRSEPYCYSAHEGSPAGDEPPLYEPEGDTSQAPGAEPAGPAPQPGEGTADAELPVPLESPQLETGPQVIEPSQGEPEAAPAEVTS